ncbi:hypothetical protein ABT255_42400 [Streptomyces mirabilis]|uniref:hypothetical protein n=1 Tax=Streptomyces mirabilis TaxID=68239 RepID=UPI003331D049
MSSKKIPVAKRQRLLTKALKKSLRMCSNGCGTAKAGANYCADCGTKLPIVGGPTALTKNAPAPTPMAAPAFLAKSAASTDPLRFGSVDDPDPAERERVFQEQYNRRLDAPVVKSASAPDEPPFWDPNSADPAERERAWREEHELSMDKGQGAPRASTRHAPFAVQDLMDALYHSDPAIREATWNALNSRVTKGW